MRRGLRRHQQQGKAGFPETKQGKGFLLLGGALGHQELFAQTVGNGVAFPCAFQPGPMAELLLHGSQYLENPAANDLLVLRFQNIVAGMELNAYAARDIAE